MHYGFFAIRVGVGYKFAIFLFDYHGYTIVQFSSILSGFTRGGSHARGLRTFCVGVVVLQGGCGFVLCGLGVFARQSISGGAIVGVGGFQIGFVVLFEGAVVEVQLTLFIGLNNGVSFSTIRQRGSSHVVGHESTRYCTQVGGFGVKVFYGRPEGCTLIFFL